LHRESSSLRIRVRYRPEAARRKNVLCRILALTASGMNRKEVSGKWLNTFICPVRLGRCNSLPCDASNNGVCLKFSSGEAARATVLSRPIRQESMAATRRDPCALRDALYTRTQRPPIADTSFSEDCPKRNDRPTGVNFASETDGLGSPLLTPSL